MRYLFALFLAAALTTGIVRAGNMGGIRGSVSGRNGSVITRLKNERVTVRWPFIEMHDAHGTYYLPGPELSWTTTDKNGYFTFMSLPTGPLVLEVDGDLRYFPDYVDVCVQADVFQSLPVLLWTGGSGTPQMAAAHRYNSTLRYRPNRYITSDLYEMDDC